MSITFYNVRIDCNPVKKKGESLEKNPSSQLREFYTL